MLTTNTLPDAGPTEREIDLAAALYEAREAEEDRRERRWVELGCPDPEHYDAETDSWLLPDGRVVPCLEVHA